MIGDAAHPFIHPAERHRPEVYVPEAVTDFDEFERPVEVARLEALALLVVSSWEAKRGCDAVR